MSERAFHIEEDKVKQSDQNMKAKRNEDDKVKQGDQSVREKLGEALGDEGKCWVMVNQKNKAKVVSFFLTNFLHNFGQKQFWEIFNDMVM